MPQPLTKARESLAAARQARSRSIKQKLTWMNMLVSASALLVACGAFVAYEATTFRLSMARRLSVQAQIVGANSASALLFGDPDSARRTLSALNAAPNVLFAGIYTPAGETLATYVRAGAEPLPLPPLAANLGENHWFAGGELQLVRRIVFQGKNIGAVYLRSDLHEQNQRLIGYVGIGAVVLLVSLATAFLLSPRFQRTIAQPLVGLAGVARVVSRERNYSIRAPASASRDEIAQLIDAFNEMLGQIQERDSALQAAQEELERRVAQRTAELESVNKELEAFTYSVAHDLRAPLRHIQGFSVALEEEFRAQLPPTAVEYLTRIVGGTKRMGLLINDLLALAQVGRQELHLRRTSLNSLVEEVLQELRDEIPDRSVRWQIGELDAADSDPGLMRQVFYNLLSNAVKYTRPRNPAVIETGQARINGERVIFVRDNGVGFNMKYSDKLFGVFQRLHRREDFDGTGVGLATVQRIVHKHGGRIWAEAEVDKGAAFFFTLAPAPSQREEIADVG
jgi:signal transduction histidine kinase